MTLPKIPRDPVDDYSAAAIAARREYAEEQTGAQLEHVSSYSLGPGTLPGNIENFVGVAQVPIEVPPGVDIATQVITNGGQVSESALELGIPESTRVSLLPLPGAVPIWRRELMRPSRSCA